MKTVIKKSLRVRINPKSVLKRMGVRNREEKWLGLISQICDEYAVKIHPRGVYREAFCTPNGRTINIGENIHLESLFLKNRLPIPQKAAIFLVTIGSELEESIRKGMSRDQNRTAYILDCLGSSAAESAAGALHHEVQERFDIKMCRYSPGYNDWNISQQKDLFRFLGVESTRELGIDLTSDFMMTPRKSVSGIILPKKEYGTHVLV